MNVRIIIDSTTDVIPSVKEKCTVIPVILRFGETEYLDGVTISHNEFYEKLAACDTLPTTSQPTPDTFAQVYQQIVDTGEKAVVLTLSSKLSGTYQSATIAAMDFPGQVYVVDSQNVTIGAGVLAQLAVELAEQGASAEEIVSTINRERENVRLVAMVDTLEYLKKGGRISKTAAFAGGLLSIKPIIQVLDGELRIMGKARGIKQANAMLDQQIRETGGIDFDKPVLLGYTGISEIPLARYASDSAVLNKQERREYYAAAIGSVIGTHVGPGAYAAAYFKKG